MEEPRGGPNQPGYATWSRWITAVAGLLLAPVLVSGRPATATPISVQVPTIARPASTTVDTETAAARTRPAGRILRDRGPLVIAHRGGESDSPESTIEAFTHSIAAGADGILFDVRFTRDGVPVVLHDETLDRTTDCTGPVEAISAADLRRCDAGAIDDDAFGFQHVPTLDEALDFIGSHSSKTQIFLHCKVVRERGQAAALVDAVRDHGLNTAARTAFLSDSAAFIQQMAEAGAARVGMVFHDWDKDYALRSRYPVLLSWDVPVTASDVARAAANGQLLIASKDHPQSLDNLVRLGLPAVAVDDLDGTMDMLGRAESAAAGETPDPAHI